MTDELPPWAAALVARRTLWQNYGIPWTDVTFEEIMAALKLETAILERNKHGR